MDRGKFVALTILFLFAHSAAGAPLIRTVALSGQQAPGTPTGVVYSSFSIDVPIINQLGQVAFVARLASLPGEVTANNDYGFWSEDGNSLNLVAREGFQAVGAPAGANTGEFTSGQIRINSLGQVAYLNDLQVGSGGVTALSNQGIWLGPLANLQLVAREQSQAPGLPANTLFGTVDDISRKLLFNDQGQVAFQSTLQGAGVTSANSDSLWSQTGGNLHLAARSGEPAPGTAPGTLFANFGGIFHDSITFNQSGQLVFKGLLREGTGDAVDSNREGIWSDRNGSLELVVRAGDHAPGTPTETKFYRFSELSSNNHGDSAFVSMLMGGGATFNNWTGIWSENNGNLEMVARSGDQAPGAAAGTLFNLDSGITTQLVFNDRGEVAFTSRLVGGGFNSGIWSGTPNNLQLIANGGAPAPGANGAFFSIFSRLAFNNIGQAAFLASLSDGRDGIWAQDASGDLQLLALEGTMLEVAPGDFRNISLIDSLGFYGNNEGSAITFNDRGQLVFRASFTGGTSGIFVSNVVAVPEPTALALMALVIAGNFVRRWS